MMECEDKFMSNVLPEPTSGCWLWAGAMFGTGYGNFYYIGKRLAAHRASYELFVGPIPDGLCVLHKCDVRLCVNPDHLFVGTTRDNAIDMVSKGRGVDNSGENHGMSKLKEFQVRVIKRLLKFGTLRQCEIAELFNVSRSAISYINSGKLWGHVK